MPSLSQSPILQALGYAIANSLWQMAMVWIVYVLLNSVFKFKSEIKFRIAVAAQIIGFSWFLVTLQFYYRQCSQALEVAESMLLQNGDDQTYVVAGEQGSLLSYFLKAEQVLPYLSVAYLLLLVFLTIRWFRAYRYTQLVRLNGLHKIDIDWKLFVSKVAGQLGIKQKVRIFLSEIVESPVTIGFLKPVILIPIASINHLTPQQLEAIILHELAHIKRHDYILNILLSIIELGLFFNPFTRLITRSISKERENSCDDWVLQYQYNPSMYAEALLRIAVLQRNPSMAMHAVKTKGELLSRVHRMVHQKDSRFNYRHQLIALLLMTGILASLAWFDTSAMKAGDSKTMEAKQAVVLEPLAAKVDNPLFNPLSMLNPQLKEEVKETVARVNEKHASKLKREATQMREIAFPRVLAPVAIENMKDIEKRIASVNREVKRAWGQAASQMRLAQNAYHFDTLQLSQYMNMAANNFTFVGGEDLYYKSMEEASKELQKSQKALEEAVKKGTMSRAVARLQMAELNAAMKKLKEVKMPQVFTFNPAFPGYEYFYRWNDNEDGQKEKAEADEKRRVNTQGQGETRTSNIRRVHVTDSVKQRLVAKANGQVPAAAHGFVALTEGAPVVVIDGKSLNNLKTITVEGFRANAPAISGDNKLKEVTVWGYATNSNGIASTGGGYEDECEKANSTDKSRRITFTTGQGRTRSVSASTPKPRKPATGSGCASASSNTDQKNKAGETIVLDVQLQ